MNTIENIEPTVKVLPLQTKTEMIVARLNADYEAERAVIRKKMNEERDCIDAVEVIRNQHKENIRKLQNEEDALRVKWMEEKARVLEESEYNRGKDGEVENTPSVTKREAEMPNEDDVVTIHPIARVWFQPTPLKAVPSKFTPIS